MTSVMNHKKFSRSEFPLMEPLPDKSWEDPTAKKTPPTEAHGVKFSVVKGEQIEHYPNQQPSINQSLYNELHKQCTIVDKFHKNNLKLMADFKEELLDQNQQLIPALEEFTRGIKEPAKERETPESVFKNCELSHSYENIKKLSNSTPIDKNCLSELLMKMTKTSSRVERSEIKDRLLEIITVIAGDSTDPSPIMSALEKGSDLASADVLQFLNLELSGTSKQIDTDLMQSKILSAKRSAALTIGDKETVSSLEVEIEKQLYSLTETQHSRIQSIILCNGDIEEHAAQVRFMFFFFFFEKKKKKKKTQ